MGHVSHPIRRLNDLAECCVFGKQSVDPFHCDPHHFGDSLFASLLVKIASLGRFIRLWRTNHLAESPKWCGHPFFRSYGARLPSSLTRFHSRALAQLCPPTCVGLRYGQPWELLVAFLDTSFNRSSSAEASTSLLLRADGHFQPTACHYSCVQLHLTTAGAGILNPLSIPYALRPQLTSRLTLGVRALPRKPRLYGGQEF